MWVALIQSLENLNKTKTLARELLLSYYLSWEMMFHPQALGWG